MSYVNDYEIAYLIGRACSKINAIFDICFHYVSLNNVTYWWEDPIIYR